MQTEPFKVYQGSNATRNTDEYKYLGMYVNSSLDLNSHFERSYKKAAGRLRLLARLRKYLDSQSARDILLYDHACFYLLRCSADESVRNQDETAESIP